MSSPGQPQIKTSGDTRVVGQDIFTRHVVPPCVAAVADVADSVGGSGVVTVPARSSRRIASWPVWFLKDRNSLLIFFVNDERPPGEGERFEGLQPGSQFADLWLKLLCFGQFLKFRRISQRPIAIADTGKERLQCVVVFGRYRIEFVVVTPGTADRQAKERRAGSNNHFVESVLACQTLRFLVLADLTG